MKVAELMQTDLRTIGAGATVADAIAALVQRQISALPVVDERRQPIGVVTNDDVVRATIGHDPEGWAPELTPVAEIMSPWPPSVRADDGVAEAARLMLYLDLKRVFVVDHGAVVGVLSQSDVTGAVATARI